MGINKEQKRYSSGIELKLKPLSTLTLFCPPNNEAAVVSSSCRGIEREREKKGSDPEEHNRMERKVMKRKKVRAKGNKGGFKNGKTEKIKS